MRGKGGCNRTAHSKWRLLNWPVAIGQQRREHARMPRCVTKPKWCIRCANVLLARKRRRVRHAPRYMLIPGSPHLQWYSTRGSHPVTLMFPASGITTHHKCASLSNKDAPWPDRTRSGRSPTLTERAQICRLQFVQNCLAVATQLVRTYGVHWLAATNIASPTMHAPRR